MRIVQNGLRSSCSGTAATRRRFISGRRGFASSVAVVEPPVEANVATKSSRSSTSTASDPNEGLQALFDRAFRRLPSTSGAEAQNQERAQGARRRSIDVLLQQVADRLSTKNGEPHDQVGSGTFELRAAQQEAARTRAFLHDAFNGLSSRELADALERVPQAAERLAEHTGTAPGSSSFSPTTRTVSLLRPALRTMLLRTERAARGESTLDYELARAASCGRRHLLDTPLLVAKLDSAVERLVKRLSSAGDAFETAGPTSSSSAGRSTTWCLEKNRTLASLLDYQTVYNSCQPSSLASRDSATSEHGITHMFTAPLAVQILAQHAANASSDVSIARGPPQATTTIFTAAEVVEKPIVQEKARATLADNAARWLVSHCADQRAPLAVPDAFVLIEAIGRLQLCTRGATTSGRLVLCETSNGVPSKRVWQAPTTAVMNTRPHAVLAEHSGELLQLAWPALVNHALAAGWVGERPTTTRSNTALSCRPQLSGVLNCQTVATYLRGFFPSTRGEQSLSSSLLGRRAHGREGAAPSQGKAESARAFAESLPDAQKDSFLSRAAEELIGEVSAADPLVAASVTEGHQRASAGLSALDLVQNQADRNEAALWLLAEVDCDTAPLAARLNLVHEVVRIATDGSFLLHDNKNGLFAIATDLVRRLLLAPEMRLEKAELADFALLLVRARKVVPAAVFPLIAEVEEREFGEKRLNRIREIPLAGMQMLDVLKVLYGGAATGRENGNTVVGDGGGVVDTSVSLAWRWLELVATKAVQSEDFLATLSVADLARAATLLSKCGKKKLGGTMLETSMNLFEKTILKRRADSDVLTLEGTSSTIVDEVPAELWAALSCVHPKQTRSAFAALYPLLPLGTTAECRDDTEAHVLIMGLLRHRAHMLHSTITTTAGAGTKTGEKLEARNFEQDYHLQRRLAELLDFSDHKRDSFTVAGATRTQVVHVPTTSSTLSLNNSDFAALWRYVARLDWSRRFLLDSLLAATERRLPSFQQKDVRGVVNSMATLRVHHGPLLEKLLARHAEAGGPTAADQDYVKARVRLASSEEPMSTIRLQEGRHPSPSAGLAAPGGRKHKKKLSNGTRRNAGKATWQSKEKRSQLASSLLQLCRDLYRLAYFETGSGSCAIRQSFFPEQRTHPASARAATTRQRSLFHSLSLGGQFEVLRYLAASNFFPPVETKLAWARAAHAYRRWLAFTPFKAGRRNREQTRRMLVAAGSAAAGPAGVVGELRDVRGNRAVLELFLRSVCNPGLLSGRPNTSSDHAGATDINVNWLAMWLTRDSGLEIAPMLRDLVLPEWTRYEEERHADVRKKLGDVFEEVNQVESSAAGWGASGAVGDSSAHVVEELTLSKNKQVDRSDVVGKILDDCFFLYQWKSTRYADGAVPLPMRVKAAGGVVRRAREQSEEHEEEDYLQEVFDVARGEHDTASAGTRRRLQLLRSAVPETHHDRPQHHDHEDETVHLNYTLGDEAGAQLRARPKRLLLSPKAALQEKGEIMAAAAGRDFRDEGDAITGRTDDAGDCNENGGFSVSPNIETRQDAFVKRGASIFPSAAGMRRKLLLRTEKDPAAVGGSPVRQFSTSSSSTCADGDETSSCSGNPNSFVVDERDFSTLEKVEFDVTPQQPSHDESPLSRASQASRGSGAGSADSSDAAVSARDSPTRKLKTNTGATEVTLADIRDAIEECGGYRATVRAAEAAIGRKFNLWGPGRIRQITRKRLEYFIRDEFPPVVPTSRDALKMRRVVEEFLAKETHRTGERQSEVPNLRTNAKFAQFLERNGFNFWVAEAVLKSQSAAYFTGNIKVVTLGGMEKSVDGTVVDGDRHDDIFASREEENNPEAFEKRQGQVRNLIRALASTRFTAGTPYREFHIQRALKTQLGLKNWRETKKYLGKKLDAFLVYDCDAPAGISPIVPGGAGGRGAAEGAAESREMAQRRKERARKIELGKMRRQLTAEFRQQAVKEREAQAEKLRERVAKLQERLSGALVPGGGGTSATSSSATSVADVLQRLNSLEKGEGEAVGTISADSSAKDSRAERSRSDAESITSTPPQLHQLLRLRLRRLVAVHGDKKRLARHIKVRTHRKEAVEARAKAREAITNASGTEHSSKLIVGFPEAEELRFYRGRSGADAAQRDSGRTAEAEITDLPVTGDARARLELLKALGYDVTPVLESEWRHDHVGSRRDFLREIFIC